jgi:hypothetical protein
MLPGFLNYFTKAKLPTDAASSSDGSDNNSVEKSGNRAVNKFFNQQNVGQLQIFLRCAPGISLS